MFQIYAKRREFAYFLDLGRKTMYNYDKNVFTEKGMKYEIDRPFER